MNSPERFDDLLSEHLRADAPREAPHRTLEATMNRIATTPQRGGTWLANPFATLLAVAAVVLLAVVAGTQFPGLIDRPVGTDASPSASFAPSDSAAPSATPAASASPSPQPTETPVAASDGLLLRLVTLGGGPTYPSQLLPWATLMADGTLIWQPVPAATETGSLVTRTLTPDGLAELRAHIFGSGLLDSSASHELESLPGVEPPGRGVSVYTFTAGDGDDQVVVTSVQWLGDDDEATYYQPSPERKQLDVLAQELRDPEALVGADGWTGPVEPYEGTDYQLLLTPYRDFPPYETSDIEELPLPFDGPIDGFGVESGAPQPPSTRCGAISRDEAAQVIDTLAGLGFEQTGLDRATTGSLDWADGNGTVDLFLLPRMPDAYPECGGQP